MSFIQMRDVEDAVISSFLFFGTMDSDDKTNIFELNEKYFTTKFRKRMVRRINDAIKAGQSLQKLCTELEDKVEGTSHHLPFVEILSQSPMSIEIAREYHDDILAKNYIQNLI